MPIRTPSRLPASGESREELFARARQELHGARFDIVPPSAPRRPAPSAKPAQRRGLFGRAKPVEEPAPVAAHEPGEPLRLEVAAAAAEIGARSHGWGEFIHRVKAGESVGRVYPAIRILSDKNRFKRGLDDNNLIRELGIGHVSPELLHTLGSRYPSGELTGNPRTPTGHLLLARINGIMSDAFNAHEAAIRAALLEKSPALRTLAGTHGLEFYDDGGAVTAVVHSMSPKESRENARAGLREVLAAKKRASQRIQDALRPRR
ncbi:hypothetical protein AUJ14_03130 [Candidatus Micrarchaeota archaeon CG1_02_55_22]|nr:MAG: hypothetical protein AUJ14_03130 [Candidatus Micrarchaeota archaeon CG1_02_55_22]